MGKVKLLSIDNEIKKRVGIVLSSEDVEKIVKGITAVTDKVKQIRIKYLAPDIEPVREISQGDWIDLRAAADIHIEKGEYRMIPLGVALELPEGYEAIVAPRSSTFKHFGILMANSIGVIDESYCGDNDEWHFPAYATKATFIRKNDRICQFRILRHQEPVIFETVTELGNSDRGGFGSTGRR